MAKTSSIEKNNRRKRMAANDYEKRAALKAIIMNKNLPLNERFQATLKLSKLRKNGAKVRVRNRCELTGRSRGYYKFFGISRICLRELAGTGMLPGVIKASW